MCEVAGEPAAAELMSRIEHAEALMTQTQLGTPSGRGVTTAPHDFRDDDPPPF